MSPPRTLRVVTCPRWVPARGPSSPSLTALLCPQLILVASDLGQPVPYETMQPLQVALEDIDDNEPLFVRPPVSSPIRCPGHSHTGTHLPASTVRTRFRVRTVPYTHMITCGNCTALHRATSY